MAAIAAVLLILAATSAAQQQQQQQKQQQQGNQQQKQQQQEEEKLQQRRCAGGSSVCNAIVRFPDRVIDQGAYCAGCGPCGPEVAAGARNSFLWQHYEHPKMLVQFVLCQQLPPKRECGSHDRTAAVFVSPQSEWRLQLSQLYCDCPAAHGDRVPVHHLKSWRLEGSQWYYEFGCSQRQCPIEDGDASACAEKRRANKDAPVDVTFNCACPSTHHCTVSDLNLKNDEAKDTKPAVKQWLPDSRGGLVSRKWCVKRDVNQTALMS